MAINGIDLTTPFSIIFGTIWIIGYFSFVLLVIRFHPKDIKQRRWKAALFIAGLPISGMPLFFSVILLFAAPFQFNYSDFDTKTLLEYIHNWFTSLATISICFFPLLAPIAIFATFGTYNRLHGFDSLLNKIVPPSLDEKPNVHEYM